MAISGAKIRQARGDMPRVRLAFEIGKILGEPITEATIGNWERGTCEPNGRNLDALCIVLDCAPGDFHDDPRERATA